MKEEDSEQPWENQEDKATKEREIQTDRERERERESKANA